VSIKKKINYLYKYKELHKKKVVID